MNIRAYAKINLCLDVLGRRPDGYHEVRMIMQQLELCDGIELEMLPQPGIELTVSDPSVPSDGRNLMYRAAALLQESCGIRKGIRMHLEKRIPSAAGLAGGSSDAAAVLTGMNELFGLGLSQAELREKGRQLGADIPYCILGGTALSEGIGEILTPLSTGLRLPVLLVKPSAGCSTPEVYGAYDRLKAQGTELPQPDVDAMLSALKHNEKEELYRTVCNVLEPAVIPSVPLVKRIREDLLRNGASAACMSGSGSTVFGLFEDETVMEAAAGAFENAMYRPDLSDIIRTKFRE